MTWIRRTLATISLTGLLTACGGSLQYRAPELDWQTATHREAIDLDSDANNLPPGFSSRGYLNEDASECQGENCYDLVVEAIDTEGNEEYNLVRITLDTQIVNHSLGFASERAPVRVILADGDRDGEVDHAWIDDEGGNPGFDGRYDRDEDVTVGFSEYITAIFSQYMRQ